MSKIAGKFSLISERNKGPKLVIKPFKLAVQASCLMEGDKTRRVIKGKGGGETPFPSPLSSTLVEFYCSSQFFLLKKSAKRFCYQFPLFWRSPSRGRNCC